MIATEQGAVDHMLDRFLTMWSAKGFVADYPNAQFQIPDQPTTWARIAVQHYRGGRSSLTGALGKVKFKNAGTLFIQLFVPLNIGCDYNLCSEVLDVYRKPVGGFCVTFANERINEVGRDGVFYQTNLLVDFSYELVK